MLGKRSSYYGSLQRIILYEKEVKMEEHSVAVTLHGNPFTLVGTQPNVGDKAPDIELLDNDLNPVKLSSFQGKVCIIASVPSLDTPTCDMETRRFNEAAGQLGEDVAILTVSTDLPFAQKRWCGAAGVENVVTLSDHRDAAFGEAYGVLIKELRLLGRSIFVIDRDGVIQYTEHVKELSEQPNYDAVLAAAQKLV
jgi:thiol peroxidase